ncbi:MAG: helix-turn-helix transcriptional regulator [Pseudomonadales bacterium]|jgi:DNA-binding CsgD family transcriptional regulator/PAS domain-containing protein|nr:helix-turn-helix transcriptional regulator [Pseudomonadales bacterium]
MENAENHNRSMPRKPVKSTGVRTGSRHTAAAIIEQLYQGVLDDPSWNLALRGMANLTGSAALTLISSSQGDHVVADETGNPEGAAARYRDYYHQYDTGLAIMKRNPKGLWYVAQQDLGEQYARDTFYQEFFRGMDMGAHAGQCVLRDRGVTAYLGMTRYLDQPCYADEELKQFDLDFLSHLRRALPLRIEMKRQAAQSGLARVALGKSRDAMLVIDGNARIQYANESAEVLLRRAAHLLPVNGGRLQPQGLEPGQFDLLARAACASGASQAGECLLTHGEKQSLTALRVQLLPLSPELQTLNPWPRPMALVLIRPFEHKRQAPPKAAMLRELYELSPAETRVALLLFQNSDLPGIARDLSISMGTVRDHLHRIFNKTGTRSQADLIRLLAGLATLDSEA